MTTQTEQTSEPKTEFKTVSAVDQITLIKGAVQAVIDNLSKVEITKAEAGKIEGGQLAILQNALKDFPEPVTEEAWDTLFKANVRDLLAGAEVNGSKRYANPSSRDVMVNNFKAATMGLTLAKQDRTFAPTQDTSKNLKKYATAVRPKLQAAIDPATGKPRLRSIEVAPKEPKMLSNDTYYYLFGCEGSSVRPGMVLLAKWHGFSQLKDSLAAARREGKFQSFFYCAGKMEPLLVEEHEIVIKTAVTSSAPVPK
jgi:hypothetical protein